MADLRIRTLQRRDRAAVAALISDSTNQWYQAHGRPPIFAGGAASTELFCDVYEALDPGCCLLAEDPHTGELLGSCFYHPRPTHVSLGIMNVAPGHFGRSVGSRLLQRVIAIADAAALPLRLVSSALNLDSYSLYTRAGFAPRTLYQDMRLPLPQVAAATAQGLDRVRPARERDLDAIVALGTAIEGLARERDFRFFLDNPGGIWHVSVYETLAGRIEGCLASVVHPGSTMLGPGFCRDQQQAAALILAELQQRRGAEPVFLVPAHCAELVARLYGWGARNCELHVHQVRGAWREPDGVSMPTFMPETA